MTNDEFQTPPQDEPKNDLPSLKFNRIRPYFIAVTLHDSPHIARKHVLEVLQDVFNKPYPEAFDLIGQLHDEKSIVLGRFPADIAAHKLDLVEKIGEISGQPLHLTYEKA